MDQDYTNYYHVDYLLQHLYYRDITDWHGLGLILWDVHDILTRHMVLTDEELQLVEMLAAGYELHEVPIEVREGYQGIIEKFIEFNQDREEE